MDFELLKSRFNERAIKQLLTMFVETAPGEVFNIEKSLTNQAFHEVRDQAHSFRGACSTICATDLLRNCREVEMAADTADKEQCETLFANLKSTFMSTLCEIEERLVSAG